MATISTAELVRAINGAERIASNLLGGNFHAAHREIAQQRLRGPLIQAFNQHLREDGKDGELVLLYRGILEALGLAYKAPCREAGQTIRDYCVAIREHLGATGQGDERDGMVFQSILPWPAHIPERNRLKFLDEHKAEIPNRSEGRRRKVDAAAFLAYWAKRDRAGFSSLDEIQAGDLPGIMPETVPDAEYLENVVPLLKRVAGTKPKRRRKR